MIKLTANGKRIDTAQIERLFTQGESFSDRIHILLPTVNNDVDVTGCTFVMRTAASDGSMTETLLTKELQEEVILLTWDVPDTVTAVAGSLRLELIGSTDSSVIIKYRMPPVYVKEAVMGTNLPVPDVIDEKLALMNQILAGMNTNTNQEVIDARTGYFSGYTYASLQQRLNAELSVCVQQSTYERNMASLAAKDSELEREIAAARYGYGYTAGEARPSYLTLDDRINFDLTAFREAYKREIQQNAALTASTLGTPLKKNLLPYPASVAKGGITFTFDSNGYMTASETSADSRQWTAAGSQYSVKLRAGTYILSFVSSTASTNAYGNIMVLDADSTKIADIGQKNYAKQQSGSVEFTLDTDQTVYVMAKIFDGTTGIMLRHADITDGTYEPYTKSIQEQLDELKAQIAAMTTAAATTETEE